MEKKQLLFGLCVMGVLVVVLVLIFGAPSTSPYKNPYYDLISDRIIWKTEYNEVLEHDTVAEMLLLPDDILDTWLCCNSTITVVEPKKGILDDFESTGTITKKVKESYFTVALNELTIEDGKVSASHIYILGSSKYVSQSLLHEIGHFVYWNDNISFTPDKENMTYFVEQECNGEEHYLDTEEYYCELFSYVIKNGTSDNYPDTYLINKK